MLLEYLALPQCWMTLVVVVALAVKSWRHEWRMPSMDDFVELIAYFVGLYGTKIVFVESLKQKDHPDIGFALMCAACLLAFVSIRGTWRTVTRVETAEPTTATKKPEAKVAPEKSRD